MTENQILVARKRLEAETELSALLPTLKKLERKKADLNRLLRLLKYKPDEYAMRYKHEFLTDKEIDEKWQELSDQHDRIKFPLIKIT